VAARQHGVLTRAQLLAAGVTPRVLDGLVAAGWLRRLHTSVYEIGPAPAAGPRRLMAAALALGPRAVVSDASAAELWQLLGPRDALHVTLPTRAGHAVRDAIHVHRRVLRADERTVRHGVPCTTLTRTLFDVACSPRDFPRAFEEAQVRHGFRPALLAAEVLMRPGQRGVGRIRTALAGAIDPGDVESVLELRFLGFCADQRLPRPRTQVPLGPWRADFLFAEHGLVVETDGARFHGTTAKRVRDQRKTTALEEMGLRVLRVTWADIHDRPSLLATRLALALKGS
jgi:very-short-patch-repair endonuclease